MDFNALQHKLFELDPSDPAEDLRKLTESAGAAPQQNVSETVNYVQKSVEVQEGTMPVEGDYSLSDFAALAGVTLNESQKTGSAGQAKGKDPMPSAKPGRTKHPLKDKLVGEGPIDALDKFKKSKYAKSFSAGADNYNTLGGPMAVARAATGGDTSSSKPAPTLKKSTTSPNANIAKNANDWKGFLKQHTVGLKAIASDPKKKKEFDVFMAKMGENIEEENKGLYHNVNKRKKAGTSRKQGHPKAPTAQAWKDAAKTAKKESVESIKDMLYRKLNDKK